MTTCDAAHDHATPVLSLAAQHAPDNALVSLIGANFELVIVFGVGGLIALTSIVFGILKSISVTREHERTKREVAAYIAEGSMTPDDAERILRGGRKS